MDVDAFNQEDTFEYQITLPSGEKLDAVLVLAGPGHPIREKFEKRKFSRAARAFNKKGKSEIPEDADDLLSDTVERLAQFTLDWRNLTQNGQPLPFSIEAAKAFYGHQKRAWLREVVGAALLDHENFMKSSAPASKNSPSTSSN